MSKLSDAQAAIADLKLGVVYRGINELRPHPRTPRKHPNTQIKKLVKGIKANGFVVPVLVDRDLRILAGHARLTAARRLGLTTVPSICLDHLGDAQADAFMLADN